MSWECPSCGAAPGEGKGCLRCTAPPPLRPVAVPSQPTANATSMPAKPTLMQIDGVLAERVARLEQNMRRYGGLPIEPMRCPKCRAALSQAVLNWYWNPEGEHWSHYCRGGRIGYAAEPDV